MIFIFVKSTAFTPFFELKWLNQSDNSPEIRPSDSGLLI
jgi:hypothetical protein